MSNNPFMKRLHILHLVTSILFFCMLLLGVLLLVFSFSYAFGYDLGIHYTVTLHGSNKQLALGLFLPLLILLYSSYVYAIYLFKKCIASFIKIKIFEPYIIRNFNRIGYIFLTGYLLTVLFSATMRITDENGAIRLDTEYDIMQFLLTPVNGFIIGLFFLVLSKVFQIAKIQKEENIELKQENELTI